MEKIKFSVIIPTRERADTLFHSISTCIAQDYENLDIIVSDNFSQDNTREVVSSFSDPRIKYINTGKRVSMSHNWEFALNHVTDGWVTFLGDDDGLLPGAIRTVADVIEKTSCQAITSQLCSYWWSDYSAEEPGWLNVVANSLLVTLGTGFQVRKTGDWLDKIMRGDAIYYELPWLYLGGFAEIHCINHAREENGVFFHSMVPDIYSAIALASVLDTYVKINEPIAVCGISAHSTGTSSFSNNNLEPRKKFLSEDNIPFHQSLAGGELQKSIQLLVYECYLQSSHLRHDSSKITMEDQLALALTTVAKPNYANLREYCIKLTRKNGININQVDHKVNNLKVKQLFRQFRRMLNVILGQFNLSSTRQVMIQDAREFGVTNVNQATLLVKSIFLLKTYYKNLQMELLVRLIKNGFKRVFHY